MDLGKERWIDELNDFLLEGHTKGWAADADPSPQMIPGMKSIYYSRDDWEYRDIYAGYFKAPGFTLVSFRRTPVWSMSYFGEGQVQGREESAKQTFEFLKEALLQVDPAMPFRGPTYYGCGGWEYKFIFQQGDIEGFLGREEILFERELIFTQNVGGGIIVPKDDRARPVYPWKLT